MAKVRGRGRLTGLELLPEECGPVVAWAAEQLKDRDRTQTEIYEEFYAKLEALRQEYRGELEFTIPSFSAFNRYSIKLAALTQRLEETREIATSIAGRFDAQADDDLTIIAASAIKTLVFELIMGAGEAGRDPKEAMQLAAALRSAAQAQGVSTARRQKVEKEFGEKVTEAVQTVARTKGISADATDEILSRILGVSK
ncbi:DUF3486 family protein [Brucella anthropi]|uniref:DUF3486 family protein n=1 Tax=Brucella anthropi TaxID=529 RepID=UPI000F67C6F1|nr:DUF3486 family protein [Brucella anthropi]RRY09019.1 DUF3486 family protein [Brucella anthropi]